jgi:hypothetical protein
MGLVQGNNMIYKKVIVVLITFLLSSCDTNNANVSDKTNSETKSISVSTAETQSQRVLNDAVNALQSVEDEFHWRDTHLVLEESQKALNDGKFELSIELAQKVIQQTKLMHEQKDFADNNWHGLIPQK